MEMSALVNAQASHKCNIDRAFLNFKKCPKERRLEESYLLTRLEGLEEQWRAFSETHKRLALEFDIDQLAKTSYSVEGMYEAVEETYFDYKSDLRDCLVEAKRTSIALVPQAGPDQCNIKLPKIALPTFSGSYSEWTTFRDLYTSLVHNNPGIDAVQKMHYLKGHLSGEAEQLLRHVPVTAANYQEAWETLNNRYNNKRFLVNCSLKRFLNHPTFISESSSAIKRLLDVMNDTINGLRNLGIDTNSWVPIIILLTVSKLDNGTRKAWETNIGSTTDLPTLRQLKDFLEIRFRSLEFVDEDKIIRPNVATQRKHVVYTTRTNVGFNTRNYCIYCKGEHKLSKCTEFIGLERGERQSYVQTNRLCFNCFGNHIAYYCRSWDRCEICNKRHNVLLHPVLSDVNESKAEEADSNKKESVETSASTSKVMSYFSKKTFSRQILLATALVNAVGKNGEVHVLRALLDQGSEASFITESATQLLGLKKTYCQSNISGLGANKSTLSSKYVIVININSRFDASFSIEVQAHVLSAITSLLPTKKIENVEWNGLTEIKLADPQFHTPGKIDILLGADVYSQIIREGLIKSTRDGPTAQCTALGWILTGPTHSDQSHQQLFPNHFLVGMHTHIEDNEVLRRFWEIECNTTKVKLLTPEEQVCEDIYKKTTARDDEGRYVVNLPFRSGGPRCQHGQSRDLALRRFHHLEKRFERDSEIKNQYCEVFQEYINLGHMERVPKHLKNDSNAVYLPHHAVIRSDRTTTKVRIVFDASMKGMNGVSLNDDLIVGPTIQPPLRHTIMRWRMHPICICADIIKMYRQVKITQEHVDFQRVLWRENSQDEIEEYRLLTVTFGTASAPYLAIKTLQQVAIDEGSNQAKESDTIINNFYVDDLMTGCETIDEGLELCNGIKKILEKGGFKLQKWMSNSKKLHEQISITTSTVDETSEVNGVKNIKIDDIVKILGISWDREGDELKYSVSLPLHKNSNTKRQVISDISRLFDPLGWAAPCVVKFKIFIQKLWLSGIEWDDELPLELLSEWQTYRNNLLEINNFRLPRWINRKSNDLYTELHGFCDASSAAYAAVVYLRVIDAQNNITTSLITSRTKVAPVKQQTIPRLELMGAVLLSELIYEVAQVMGIEKCHIHAWTDSTVVLAWLSSHPSRWSTFVGNRVSSILNELENSHWSYVQSINNPADIASRGVTPKELTCSDLWIQGPSWLRKETIEYIRPKSITTSLEQKSIKVHVYVEGEEENMLWSRFSSFTRLVRVVAYCRRVLKWNRRRQEKEFYDLCLSKDEIEEATKTCIKGIQRQEFNKEIETLKRTGHVHSSSKLKSLYPVIDDEGILRVGGRIHNAALDDNIKHPIILPHHHHVTELIVAEAHKETLHGGPTLMVYYLRNKFWIPSVKTLVRKHVHRCVTCKRYAQTAQTQLMGQLPSCRVTPARTFRYSGVDFAGPIAIRSSKGRGHQSYKGYICLFVCMVTKAIHLEAISDLSSNGFIAGMKRFVARRGSVSEIWSDNGSNFIGAARELRHLVEVQKSTVAKEIGEFLGNKGISWHLIPPHAPNFGGLWESGVKSTKYHLRRIIGSATLTYEELSTLLSQIEACLNSRPISMMTNGLNDPLPITPGHFLIGEPIITLPNRNFEDRNMGTLKRWQLTQRMLQNFWRKWSQDYLVNLLHRYKWNKQISEPSLGAIVLVKEDNMPPSRWLLGKIVEKHTGLDKLCRVVTLICNGSLIKRPISKLCILPVSD